MAMTELSEHVPDQPQENSVELVPGLAHSAGFLINRSGRIIRERITAALEPLPLTPQELGILRILDARGPLSQHALSRVHSIDRTTMVHVIDGLEHREFVVRMRNTSDRRSHLVYLTPRGRKTLARAIKIAQKVQDEFLAPLSTEEWESMRLSLIKLLSHHRL